MSIANHQSGLLASHAKYRDNGSRDKHRPIANGSASRSRTPNMTSEGGRGARTAGEMAERDHGAEEDPRVAMFRELYVRSEAQIAILFGQAEEDVVAESQIDCGEGVPGPARAFEQSTSDAAPKKAARNIDEDDYDDYDNDEDNVMETAPPAKPSEAPPAQNSRQSSSSTLNSAGHTNKKTLETTQLASCREVAKSSEAVRKQLQEDRQAAEDAARRSFHTLIYTLENDRDAMLEQQRLDELDRQVDAEMSNHGVPTNNVNSAPPGPGQHGKLSNTNLGASSLTLKHLIARIDAKRDQVRASDAELRSLMSEVRKNRSKWANEERVGQEELYEAAEKVLSELKAMTEHSTAFLTRVNKRDAPDYYNGEPPSLL